jgi:hypothetical protein
MAARSSSIGHWPCGAGRSARRGMRAAGLLEAGQGSISRTYQGELAIQCPIRVRERILAVSGIASASGACLMPSEPNISPSDHSSRTASTASSSVQLRSQKSTLKAPTDCQAVSEHPSSMSAGFTTRPRMTPREQETSRLDTSPSILRNATPAAAFLTTIRRLPRLLLPPASFRPVPKISHQKGHFDG